MRIVVVLPRGMTFSSAGASAIDLCARDFVVYSRFAWETTVIGEAVDRPFAGIDFRAIARDPCRSQSGTARLFADAARDCAPDLVVVHQHLPIAAAIARHLPTVPVILHKHNLPKAGGLISRWRRARQYACLARTIWVSQHAHADFIRFFPRLASAATVLHNGLDFSAWQPARKRLREIIVVGRATPEKGILEAAAAVAEVLPEHADWSTRFILSRIDNNGDYLQRVIATLAPLGDRSVVLTDQPHDVVKQAYEAAEIAVVPSRYREPFGRTALEALAGGTALISSGSGGLSEIVSDAACVLPAVTPPAIAEALDKLLKDDAARINLARHGRAEAKKRFEIRGLAAQLDAIYEDVHAGI